ncbi:MAG: Holliday junction resolvase RuvX [Gammaproteobacteria bacterium]|nr:Holliday junction resolvase RuvX [Gammaproteobacteria bacterium]MBT5406757.1 Holliday junction resolvase RuvX [Gammaproteobacteria bacterium]MBT5643620.1 Holliday junction resolvase RuvX [Gammaproteobacteria bacterium]MBT6734198.1 Holliday junction resolvase RuvX [Gammaproteobacteria bacterium]MBT7236549.1 Holliday junction resolvase RuvX [Gammaproteobacteria bacterium]
MTINKDYLYMSIDFGINKIGFAIGQLITKKATPLKIIYNSKKGINWCDIESLVAEWQPNVIIIGYPYSKVRSSFNKKLDSFIEEITEKYLDSIQIVKFSEILSTEESKVIYSDIRKSQYNIKKKSDLDDLSASVILESWFNENMIR